MASGYTYVVAMEDLNLEDTIAVCAECGAAILTTKNDTGKIGAQERHNLWHIKLKSQERKFVSNPEWTKAENEADGGG